MNSSNLELISLSLEIISSPISFVNFIESLRITYLSKVLFKEFIHTNKMESNNKKERELVKNSPEENKLKILSSLSEKPMTFSQICDYFNYKNDLRDKINYINQIFLRLKRDYQVIELKPTEENKTFLKQVFKIEWRTVTGEKIGNNRSPNYYVASPSCHKIYSFYRNFKEKFKKGIINKEELDEKFSDVMNYFRFLELTKYNYYLKIKDNEILKNDYIIRNINFYIKEGDKLTKITFISDFLEKVFDDKYIKMVFYKNLGVCNYNKKPFIKLFDGERIPKISKIVMESVYLMFKEMENVTTKDNIF